MLNVRTVSCFSPTLCGSVDRSRQAPLSMGFSRREYWSGLPGPPGDFFHQGIEPASPASFASQADTISSFNHVYTNFRRVFL